MANMMMTYIYRTSQRIHWFIVILSEYMFQNFFFTIWGPVTYICISELGHHWFPWWLAPVWYKAITCTNVKLLVTGPLERNFSEVLMETFLFMEIYLKFISSLKCHPFYSSFNVLNHYLPSCWMQSWFNQILLLSDSLLLLQIMNMSQQFYTNGKICIFDMMLTIIWTYKYSSNFMTFYDQ